MRVLDQFFTGCFHREAFSHGWLVHPSRMDGDVRVFHHILIPIRFFAPPRSGVKYTILPIETYDLDHRLPGKAGLAPDMGE